MAARTWDLTVLRFLAGRFLRPYWKAILFFAALNAAAGMLFSLRPIVLAPALDFFVKAPATPAQSLWEVNLANVGATIVAWSGARGGDPVSVSVLVAICYVAITVAVALLGYAAYAGNQRLRALVRRDMTLAAHRHMLGLPLSYFHRHKAGQLVSRLTYDVARTSAGLDSLPRELLRAGARLAVTATILVVSNVWLAFVILLVGLIHFAVTRALSVRVKSTMKALSREIADSQAALQESISTIRLIKSFGAERHDARKVSGIVEKARRFDVAANVSRYTEEPIRLVIDALLAGVILWLAFDAIDRGILSAQAALMYFYLAHQTIEPLSSIGRQLLGVQQLLGGAAPLMEVFREKSNLVEGTEIPGPLRSAIEIRSVAFAYTDNAPVLRDISLEIRRGEMVAFVGPSGAGKSTLADLILRFYDPVHGEIRYDGVDIRHFKQRDYRRKFGVVSQETLLLNATVRENIVFDKPDDAGDLAYAIRVANAEEFIRELPDGMETIIGDRGVRLSGGQRQRIAIARAIYHRPEILILDEATSALDSESERAVQEAIARAAKEMTLVVIAHRMSTITHADKIAVLNRGRLEAVDLHRSLLESSPTYRHLHALQFGADGRPGETAAG